MSRSQLQLIKLRMNVAVDGAFMIINFMQFKSPKSESAHQYKWILN